MSTQSWFGASDQIVSSRMWDVSRGLDAGAASRSSAATKLERFGGLQHVNGRRWTGEGEDARRSLSGALI